MMIERAAETAVRRAMGGSSLRIAIQTLGHGHASLAVMVAAGTAAAAWVAWQARPELGPTTALGLASGAMALVLVCALLGLSRTFGSTFERDLVHFLKRDG